jgi:hypothetical protein
MNGHDILRNRNIRMSDQPSGDAKHTSKRIECTDAMLATCKIRPGSPVTEKPSSSLASSSMRASTHTETGDSETEAERRKRCSNIGVLA